MRAASDVAKGHNRAMRTLPIWRGKIYVLEPEDDWPGVFETYAVVDLLTREIVASRRALAGPRRVGVTSSFQTCGAGEWVAIVGGTFTPRDDDRLVIEVRVGDRDGFERPVADVVLAGLCDAFEHADAPAGALVVDRALVHPVDLRLWAFRIAGATRAEALCGTRDDASLTAVATEAFVRRSWRGESNPVMG